MSRSEKIEVRVSGTLYQWLTDQAEKQGFRTRSAYLRHLLESLRLDEKQKHEEKGV